MLNGLNNWDLMGFNGTSWDFMGLLTWLVVSTSLKNISQWEGLSHILWTNTIHVPEPPTRYIFI